MTDTIHKLIIIGSGPAGLTAGIYAGRAQLNPLIIEGKSSGGQLMGTTYVENWPGEKKILGPELMKNMRDHALACNSRFLAHDVVQVNFNTHPFTLLTHKNRELKAESIILATGAQPKKLAIPGEEIYWGKGVTTCAVCDGALYKDKTVVVVGGGDTAMEDASFMTKFTDKITIIQMLDTLSASAPMKNRVMRNQNIKILYNSIVTAIQGDENHVQGILITNQTTGRQEHLKTDVVFIAIGLKPATELFKGQLELDEWGYIKVENNTKTSVPGIFAAGDVVNHHYRQAITAAGSGCMAALDAEKYLSNR